MSKNILVGICSFEKTRIELLDFFKRFGIYGNIPLHSIIVYKALSDETLKDIIEEPILDDTFIYENERMFIYIYCFEFYDYGRKEFDKIEKHLKKNRIEYHEVILKYNLPYDDIWTKMCEVNYNLMYNALKYNDKRKHYEFKNEKINKALYFIHDYEVFVFHICYKGEIPLKEFIPEIYDVKTLKEYRKSDNYETDFEYYIDSNYNIHSIE